MTLHGSMTKTQPNQWTLVLAIAAGALLPILVYQILPLLGAEQVSDILSFNNILILLAAPVLILAYGLLIRSIYQKPGLFVLGYWLLFPWLIFVNRLGFINPTPVTVLFILIPSFFIGLQQLKNARIFFERVPYFLPYILFVIAMAFYYFFFQEEILDQKNNAGQFPLGFYYLITMCANLSQIIIMLTSDQTTLFNQKFLKLFNRAVLFSTIVIAAFGIFGYPLELFNTLDNFTRRSRSIFPFPTTFANYIAFCVIYLVGYWLYYQETKKSKLISNLTLLACILGFIGLMLSFTKATIFAFAVSMFTIFLLSISSREKALQYLKYFVIILLLTAGAVLTYEKVSGNAITQSLIQRVSESASGDWRDRMNRYLSSDVDLESVWFGHGMSAAKVKMSMFESFGHDRSDPTRIAKVVHVHNSYLSQVYDYGLIGLGMFFALSWLAIRRFFIVLKTPHSHPNRPFNVAIIALIVCMMVISFADTVFELPGSPFWFLLTAMVLAEGRIRRQWA